MYSSKLNVLQTVALFKEWGIRHIVISPGSRNAPLVHSFSQDTFFDCRTVLDERDAAFKALGMIQGLRRPVAICCTSGSALLNYAPAVAEAFYQKLPLIVLSADRPSAWIGQMDGQTLPQPGAYGRLVKLAVTLPEFEAGQPEPLWHCNRLLNEALLAATGADDRLAAGLAGPVQINIPLSEPLFNYDALKLPPVRRIKAAVTRLATDSPGWAARFVAAPKKIIVVGQMFRRPALAKTLAGLAGQTGTVALAEHLSNVSLAGPEIITNFDAVLAALPPERAPDFAPDLVISLGGHLVSKRLKQFLRCHPPREHWLLSPDGQVADVFQALTDLIPGDPLTFLDGLLAELTQRVDGPGGDFQLHWREAAGQVGQPPSDLPFSDLTALGALLKELPDGCGLHLANSLPVRNAQLYPLPPGVEVFGHRGLSGIDGTLAGAVGLASVYDGPVYLALGDLSFFYGLNALCLGPSPANLRIFLLNNGGGGIFHTLPGLPGSASLHDYVAAGHRSSAAAWAAAAGLDYAGVDSQPALSRALKVFTNEKAAGGQAQLLEVFTDLEPSARVLTDYYHSLKLYQGAK
ncbi:MAG: 2-succinyl-5-enolpyruvyl-6-hydroxy-3-cyclohexene-1-carboxylic-acid synthase [Candidatus Adiutrix sp.]|jgi:2-succinyl-5-enolpyruvyl-6-hydroxy-3-cyclohexene-1-carboxylate synthase|nr:2-succinyl-5-enolpyruvyl-6-hydroxy-3-cyclohexene-1-carboxylic-acid synthase [Candidatus Adiutrix sp.]